MYCTSVDAIIGTDRDAWGAGWKSRRLMLASENRPYSVHQTTVEAGSRLRFCYQHHSETVYCLSGAAKLINMEDGRTYDVQPGFLYSVTTAEDHQLDVVEECIFLCMFDPPLRGQEEAD